MHDTTESIVATPAPGDSGTHGSTTDRAERGAFALETALADLHTASFGWALACCGANRAEAEEVLQTAYVRVLDGKALFGERSSTKTWFFGVVRKVALEQRRRRAVRGAAFARWILGLPAPEPAETPDDRTEGAAERDRIRQALSRLSRRQREVLHLVFYQDLTLEQAAEVLRMPIGTVRTHYKRGKTRLHALLTETAR